MTQANDDIVDELLATYNEYGSSAVFDLVLRKYPDWKWSLCEPCQEDTPTLSDEDGDCCAVCFTTKEQLTPDEQHIQRIVAEAAKNLHAGERVAARIGSRLRWVEENRYR